ncbi:MAG TPA: twin-arginine translocase subunit TatC [Jiangellaceae bacterium]
MVTRRESNPEGRMTLAEHLRELRSRLIKSALAVLVFAVVGFVFRDQIIGWLTDSMFEAAAQVGVEDNTRALYTKPTDALFVPMRIAMLTGFVFGAPVWIYQLWSFITPALYRNEKRWALAVIGAAVPMFAAGVALGIWIMPHAWQFLLSFTPTENVSNHIIFEEYLNFFIRVVLVFGIGFLLPVFVVLLNAIGVLRHETLSSARRWVIVGIFVFAGVATPTGDPITLLALATPMWLLFEAAVMVCRVMDRRRRPTLSPDEPTPIEDLDKMGRWDDET